MVMSGMAHHAPAPAEEKHAFVGKDKALSTCYKIPLINVIYDLLFDDPPTITQCTACMTTLALVSGLIVGVSQAVLNSVSVEDAIAFKAIKPKLYSQFVAQAALGFNGVFAGVLVCVIYFLAVSCASFGKDPLSEEAATTAWWKWTRWVVVLDLLLIVIGATGTVIAAGKLYAFQHCHPGLDLEGTDNFAETIFTLGCYVGLAGLGVVGPLLMLSGGLRAAKVAAERVHMDYTTYTVEAAEVYKELNAYLKDCPNESFVHMDKDVFVERVVDAATTGKPGVLTPMSLRLVDAIFERFAEDQIKRCRLACTAGGAPVSC